MFPYNENNRSETHLLHFSRSALRVSPRGGGAAAPGKERRHRPATARRAPPEPHPHGRARHGTARLPAACGPADLGAGGPTDSPRRGTPRSPFWCSSRTSFAVPPGRLSHGLTAGAAGQEQSEPRTARPVPVRPRALCCRSPALLPRPGRAALPPAANAAPGAGWPRRAPHVLRGAPRIRPAAGGHRAPPASRPRLHRGDGRADGAGSRRTGHRTWPQSLAFPPGRGAVSAPRRRQPPARRLPAPPRGGAHCGPEPRHVAAAAAAAAAARAPAVGRARNGGPRRAPASPRRRAQSALRERGVPGCASASEPRPSVRPSGTGSRSDVAFPQLRLSCSFPLQRWANRSLSEAAASNHTITVMSTNGTAVGKLETLCALRALDVTAQAPSQCSCL